MILLKKELSKCCPDSVPMSRVVVWVGQPGKKESYKTVNKYYYMDIKL